MTKRQVLESMMNSVLYFDIGDHRFKYHSQSMSFFIFPEFFSKISGTFVEISWIGQLTFLDFSGRLVINSRMDDEIWV